MAKRIWPTQYYNAGLQRARDAQILYRQTRYTMALYTAGLSGECVIRAFRTLENAQFDERHDLRELLKGCDRRRFEGVRHKLDGAVASLQRIWSNDYRFHSKSLILTRFEKRRLARGIDGDPVKYYASEAIDAALTIIKIGKQRWTRSKK